MSDANHGSKPKIVLTGTWSVTEASHRCGAEVKIDPQSFTSWDDVEKNINISLKKYSIKPEKVKIEIICYSDLDNINLVVSGWSSKKDIFNLLGSIEYFTSLFSGVKIQTRMVHYNGPTK